MMPAIELMIRIFDAEDAGDDGRFARVFIRFIAGDKCRHLRNIFTLGDQQVVVLLEQREVVHAQDLHQRRHDIFCRDRLFRDDRHIEVQISSSKTKLELVILLTKRIYSMIETLLKLIV